MGQGNGGRASRLRRGKGARNILLRLREVHGDTCSLCGLVMSFKSIDGGRRDSASIDHIVSKRDGGIHEDSNLRLAHRLCNTLRANAEVSGITLSRQQFKAGFEKSIYDPKKLERIVRS